MLIIIPIGGCGQRFKDDGYIRPKPLINVLGKPMLFWLLDSLNFYSTDLVLVVHTKELSRYGISTLLRKRYASIDIRCIELDQKTRGAAETVYLGIQKYKDIFDVKNTHYDTVVLDCDTFYTCNILEVCRNYSGNLITYFKSDNIDPIYSYICMDQNNMITKIKEKYKISDNANTGCYKFGGYTYEWYFDQYMDCLEYDFKEELYISGLFRWMLRKFDIKARQINSDDFHCLGTPIQVKTFSGNSLHKLIQVYPKRFCFDLDNTILFHDSSDYMDNGEINTSVVNMLRFLKKQGHTIIIYTSRRMRTHQGRVHDVIADIAPRTIETLKHHDIPYDELYFGKPYADFYIDDLGVSTFENLAKALGYTLLEDATQSRSFNQITSPDPTTISKSSSRKLDGEVYWYRNIPENVKHFFPKLHTCLQAVTEPSKIYSYEIDKIDGVPLSYLYTEKSLTLEQFDEMMNCMKQIHNSASDDNKIDIYANYYKKIKKRCNYSTLEQEIGVYTDSLYFNFLRSFGEYENFERGKKKVIHGDPVFSNILLTKDGSYKFIDMRGKLGDDLSIFGDMYYDYGKIYQSIMGYENILLDKDIDYEYQNKFIMRFESYFSDSENHWIKVIASSLLYSLIPIHLEDATNKGKCLKYFELADKIYMSTGRDNLL